MLWTLELWPIIFSLMRFGHFMFLMIGVSLKNMKIRYRITGKRRQS